jgi:hypothetical protein
MNPPGAAWVGVGALRSAARMPAPGHAWPRLRRLDRPKALQLLGLAVRVSAVVTGAQGNWPTVLRIVSAAAVGHGPPCCATLPRLGWPVETETRRAQPCASQKPDPLTANHTKPMLTISRLLLATGAGLVLAGSIRTFYSNDSLSGLLLIAALPVTAAAAIPLKLEG